MLAGLLPWSVRTKIDAEASTLLHITGSDGGLVGDLENCGNLVSSNVSDDTGLGV